MKKSILFLACLAGTIPTIVAQDANPFAGKKEINFDPISVYRNSSAAVGFIKYKADGLRAHTYFINASGSFSNDNKGVDESISNRDKLPDFINKPSKSAFITLSKGWMSLKSIKDNLFVYGELVAGANISSSKYNGSRISKTYDQNNNTYYASYATEQVYENSSYGVFTGLNFGLKWVIKKNFVLSGNVNAVRLNAGMNENKNFYQGHAWDSFNDKFVVSGNRTDNKQKGKNIDLGVNPTIGLTLGYLL